MKEIHLDSSTWKSPDDFFSALLPEREALHWHGRNLNALNDSLAGGVNGVEPPFSVIVQHSNNLSGEMDAFLAQVATVFADAGRNSDEEISFKVI